MSTTSSLDSFRVSKEDHTILTRHFYDRTSVQKAFLSACVNKHPLRKHSLSFWAHELFVSEEWELLGDTLAQALVGLLPFPGVVLLWKSWNPQSWDWVQQVLGYLAILPERVEYSACPPPPDTPLSSPVSCPPKPADWTAHQRMRLVVAVERAIHQGHGERVYRFLCGVPPSVAIRYLKSSRIPLPLLDVYTTTKKGLAHIVCCLGCSWQTPAVVVEPAKKPTSGRMFGIPTKYIQYPLHPSGFDVLYGCAYWQRVLSEYGICRDASKETGHLVFATDDALERFYGDHFPKDIPDEWSQEERAKSHTGCI
jgi:hypothetical protein